MQDFYSAERTKSKLKEFYHKGNLLGFDKTLSVDSSNSPPYTRSRISVQIIVFIKITFFSSKIVIYFLHFYSLLIFL
jgi:hypothetical protein